MTVNASGIAVPSSQISLDFSAPGRLAEVDAHVGDSVSAGTVLARLDSAVAQSNLTQAQASLAASQAQLQSAEAPLDAGTSARLQADLSSAVQLSNQTNASVQASNAQDAAVVALDRQALAADQQRQTADCAAGPTSAPCQADQSTVTSDQGRIQTDLARGSSDAASGQLRVAQANSQVSQARVAIQAASTPVPSQVAAAQAAVATATAQVQAAQTTLANLALIAPRAGTVLQVNGQVGENVTGSATGQPTLPGTAAPLPVQGASAGGGAAPLVVLGDPTGVVVGAAFTPTDAPQVHAGQTGTITATLVRGLSVPCHVLAIAQSPTSVNGVQGVWASIVPDGPSTSLTAGMTVNVSIAITRATNVLAVAQAAVYLIAGVPHVDVLQGNRSIPTVVTTGSQGSQLVQITSGLTAGQQVVISALQGLPPSVAPLLSAP